MDRLLCDDWQDSQEITDGHVLNSDLHELRNQFKNVLRERNQLILKLKETELILSEERNRQYLNSPESSDNAPKQLDSLRLNYETQLADKIRAVEEEYQEKIRLIEFCCGNEMHNPSQHVLENTIYQNFSFKHNSLTSEIDRLNSHIKDLEKKNSYLESENKRLSFLATTDSLEEKNAEHEQKIRELEHINRLNEEKVQSYKFLLEEKDRYIGSLLTENKSLVDQINSTMNIIDSATVDTENLASVLSSFTYEDVLEFHQLTQTLFAQFESVTKQIYYYIYFDQKKNEAQQSIKDYENMFQFVDKIIGYINSDNFDSIKMDYIENNFHFKSHAWRNISENFKKLQLKITDLKEHKSEIALKNIEIESHIRKIQSSSKIIDEQTTLIENLVKEIKRLKSSYKNTLDLIKDELKKERQMRLEEASKMQNYCHETEKHLFQISKANKRYKDKIITLTKENDVISCQLKFLIKQKILLSQQIEEYECHVMQHFNDSLYLEEKPN